MNVIYLDLQDLKKKLEYDSVKNYIQNESNNKYYDLQKYYVIGKYQEENKDEYNDDLISKIYDENIKNKIGKETNSLFRLMKYNRLLQHIINYKNNKKRIIDDFLSKNNNSKYDSNFYTIFDFIYINNSSNNIAELFRDANTLESAYDNLIKQQYLVSFAPSSPSTPSALTNKLNDSIKPLLSSYIATMAIAVLIGNMYTIIVNKKNQYVKEIIILCLTILIIEYYRNKPKSLIGGSLGLLSNITDMRKFYDVYTKNNLQKIDLSKDDIKMYIKELNKSLTSSFTRSEIENNNVLKELLSINLDETLKEVESNILNLNKVEDKIVNKIVKYKEEEEDINIDEKEVYKKYKEITTSLTGKLSNKSEALLLNKIKKLELLKQMINKQYNEIVEYSKLLSGVNNNMIMDLDNTLSEQKIHDYVTNYKKLIKKENKGTKNLKLILQTL